MRIFHVATRADWDAAVAAGRYTTSTRGRTLAEEGFIHASRADQWQGVRERFYADVTEPLVLLVIDTDRLSAPVVEETVSDEEHAETFPHVYGAIETGAVTQVLPLGELGTGADRMPGDGTVVPPSSSRTPRAVATRVRQETETRSVFSYFVEEMGVRAALAICVIAAAVALGVLALRLFGPLPALVTMLVVFVLGGFVIAVVLRRRDERLSG